MALSGHDNAGGYYSHSRPYHGDCVQREVTWLVCLYGSPHDDEPGRMEPREDEYNTMYFPADIGYTYL